MSEGHRSIVVELLYHRNPSTKSGSLKREPPQAFENYMVEVVASSWKVTKKMAFTQD